jgi:hypothetical protein
LSGSWVQTYGLQLNGKSLQIYSQLHLYGKTNQTANVRETHAVRHADPTKCFIGDVARLETYLVATGALDLVTLYSMGPKWRTLHFFRKTPAWSQTSITGLSTRVQDVWVELDEEPHKRPTHEMRADGLSSFLSLF